jgi:hypothetical protein
LELSVQTFDKHWLSLHKQLKLLFLPKLTKIPLKLKKEKKRKRTKDGCLNHPKYLKGGSTNPMLFGE